MKLQKQIWVSERNERYPLTEIKRRNVHLLCVTVKANKRLDRFLGNFAHRFFGAPNRSKFVNGKNRFNYFKMANILNSLITIRLKRIIQQIIVHYFCKPTTTN